MAVAFDLLKILPGARVFICSLHEKYKVLKDLSIDINFTIFENVKLLLYGGTSSHARMAS